MKITNVSVSIVQAINHPPLHLFKLIEVISHGGGVLTQVLEGGQSTSTIHLTEGTETKHYALRHGQAVTVAGTAESGEKVSFPDQLTTEKAKKDDWEFVGRFGTP